MAVVINIVKAREWLGRVDVRADQAAPAQLAALLAILDPAEPAPEIGAELPPLAHWLYFRSWGRHSEIGEDGDFLDPLLPPIELPRRHCVETRIAFHRPLRVGDPITRVSRLVDVGEKAGRAGPIVTALVRHEIADADGVALSEDRRILYTMRAEPWHAGGPRWPRGGAVWSRRFQADTRALFRYSALTSDARRIHYDRPFATFVEGHPGLVVPGGLVAALLLDMLRAHAAGARVAHCEFRSMRWLYDTEPMSLFGRPIDSRAVELWAEDSQGRLAMEGTASLDAELMLGKPAGDPASGPTHGLRRSAPRPPSRGDI